MKFEMTQNKNKKRKMLEALRGWRIGKRITQKYVAQYIGCSASNLCQLEKGLYKNVSFRTIQIYAHALGLFVRSTK